MCGVRQDREVTMRKSLSHRLTVVPFAAALACSGAQGCSFSSKPQTGATPTGVRTSTQVPAVTLREAALIEHKGLLEFSPETNATTTDPLDKQRAEELEPVLKLMGKADQVENNKKALSALNLLIEERPQWADAHFLRAGLALLAGIKDYPSILSDVDKASALHRSSQHKDIYNSAEMSALRAKVNQLAGDSSQVLKDLETILASEPNEYSEVFNTGGVNPDEVSNPTALNRQDLDSLVTQFQNDYRVYMFRGLFYLTFTTYNEDFYKPALENLKRASSLNPQSALAKYFIGITFEKMGFWTKAAASDISDMTGAGGVSKKTTTESALRYFREAINLDGGFAHAHAHIAESLYNLKRYTEAIPYFDTTIKLLPDNAEAYNDRGLAKAFSGDHYGAISDFSKAIELKRANGDAGTSLSDSLEHRAAAYVEVRNYDSGIDDYSTAIGLQFASLMFIMRLPQIRAMYSEFADIADSDLVEGLRQKYFPDWSPRKFSEVYASVEKPMEEFVIAGLYVSRGDSYLRAGHFRKAAAEYARSTRIYTHSIEFDRWKVFSQTPDAEFAVDIQTLDFSQRNLVSLWLKVTPVKSQAYQQQNYQIDCAERRLKILSAMAYDAKGRMIGSSPETDWERIGPETIGEMLHSGACR